MPGPLPPESEPTPADESPEPSGPAGAPEPQEPSSSQIEVRPTAGPTLPGVAAAATPSRSRSGFNKHVCPFCGTKREGAADDCPHCGMADSDQTRAATIARVGPWFLLQPRNPSAPGMRFSVLRELVRGGQVSAGGVVRGPSTSQLWTYAARIRGLGQLFGLCWSCNRRLPPLKPGEEPDDFCLYCGALQEAPANPDQQLEALGTGESAGVSPSPLAGQVNAARPSSAGGSERRLEVRERVGGAGGASGTSGTGATPARRAAMPRPLPSMPGDGGDALLTTRELATAFNLDRRRTLGDTVARLPWAKLVLGLLVAAFVVVGLYVAYSVLWEPARRAVGLPASDAPAQTIPGRK